jgi:hypothetical protein
MGNCRHAPYLDELGRPARATVPSLSLVDRPDLVRQLNELAPVTVVTARPGSGTTTLLGQWTDGLVAAGVTVVTADLTSVPSRGRDVATWVLAALERAEADRTGAAQGADRPAARRVLVLDGAERVDRRALEQVVAAVTSRPATHLVVRVRRPATVGDLAARHDLDVTELTSDHLSVTSDELVDYARTWGHVIASDRAQALHRQVGGWLGPARLVLDATARDDAELELAPARDFVERWIRSGGLDATLLHVARTLAVATVVTVELADVVSTISGLGQSGAVLVQRLLRSGLLSRLPSTGPGREFAFPALIGQVLLDTVEDSASSRLRRETHRAVAWHLARNVCGDMSRLGASVRHARQAQDWELLRQVWAENNLELLNSCPQDAASAFGDLPHEEVDKWPSLAIAAALSRQSVEVVGDEPEQALRRYVHVGRSLSTASLDMTRPDEVAATAAARLVARRVSGRLADALEVASWYAELSRAWRGSLRPTPRTQAWFELEWARTHLVDGNLADAIVQATAAFDTAHDREEHGFVSSGAQAPGPDPRRLGA